MGRTLKPEAQLQRNVVQILHLLGYTVLETGKTRSKVRCPQCGNFHYATGWQGNTPGLPDLYIHSSAGCWKATALAVELKTPTGKVSEEQDNLARLGMTTVCRSVEDVIGLLFRVEIHLNNWLAVDRIVRFMEANGIRKTECGVVELHDRTGTGHDSSTSS